MRVGRAHRFAILLLDVGGIDVVDVRSSREAALRAVPGEAAIRHPASGEATARGELDAEVFAAVQVIALDLRGRLRERKLKVLDRVARLIARGVAAGAAEGHGLEVFGS
jgi:hypothetical protein